MSGPDLFSARTVRTVCRISVRQFDYWVQTGLIRPASVSVTHTPEGAVSRKIYLFDFETLVEIRTIAQLRIAGVSLQEIRRVVSHLRSEHGGAWSHAWLITDGKRVFEATGSESLEELGLGGGQMAFAAVAIPSIRADVADRVASPGIATFRGGGAIQPFEPNHESRDSAFGG